MKAKPATIIVPKEYFKPAEGRALVCGSKIYPTKDFDRRSLYADPIGMDMQEGPGVDRVGDLGDAKLIKVGEFAHIDCVSVLEHCRNPWNVAFNLMRGLKAGGTVLISAPYVWRFHGYPSDYFRYTKEGIKALFPDIQWTFLQYLSEGEWFKNSPRIRQDHPLFYRSEVVGFGRKEAQATV